MPTPPDTQDTAVSSKAEQAVAFARGQIGKPYVFGAVGPNSYDCSGLIVAAYKSQGITLPHWTGALIAVGTEVAKSDLKPGDMVFPDSGHVQIYSGNGNIIEAPTQGQNVSERSMWGFWRARRVVGAGSKSQNIISVIAGAVNDISPVDEWLDVANYINRMFKNLTNPQFWMRAGQFSIATALLFVGILWMLRRPIMGVVGGVSNQVSALGQSAAGGAAFGLGARAAEKPGKIAARLSAPPRASQLPPAPGPSPQLPPPRQLPPGGGGGQPPPPPPPLQLPPGPAKYTAYVGRARRPPAPLIDPEKRGRLSDPLPGAKRHKRTNWMK